MSEGFATVPAMRFLHTSDWHLGRSLHRPDLRAAQSDFLDHLVDVLWQNPRGSLVVCGQQDVNLQVLCNCINHLLGNYGTTVDLVQPSYQLQGSDGEVETLLRELHDGRGAAGEIGHMVVKPEGRKCGCGRRGCLEAYAGRARMERRAHKLVKRGKHTVLFDLAREEGKQRLTSGVFAKAVKHADGVFQRKDAGARRGGAGAFVYEK